MTVVNWRICLHNCHNEVSKTNRNTPALQVNHLYLQYVFNNENSPQDTYTSLESLMEKDVISKPDMSALRIVLTKRVKILIVAWQPRTGSNSDGRSVRLEGGCNYLNISNSITNLGRLFIIRIHLP